MVDFESGERKHPPFVANQKKDLLNAVFGVDFSVVDLQDLLEVSFEIIQDFDPVIANYVRIREEQIVGEDPVVAENPRQQRALHPEGDPLDRTLLDDFRVLLEGYLFLEVELVDSVVQRLFGNRVFDSVLLKGLIREEVEVIA